MLQIFGIMGAVILFLILIGTFVILALPNKTAKKRIEEEERRQKRRKELEQELDLKLEELKQHDEERISSSPIEQISDLSTNNVIEE